jgi:hypothetical protein
MFNKADQERVRARRKAKARMKRKARKLYPHDECARLADHLASCSCPSCGNPRHHFNKMTMQERRAAIAAQQSIEEYG